MKRFFLLRITQELSSYDTITLTEEYLGGDGAIASEGDLLITYLKGTLEIIGIYQLTNNTIKQVLSCTNKTIRDCYDCLSFIQTIDEKTSRAFKKKTREVSEDDFKKCVAELIPPLHQNQIMTLL